MIWQITLMTLQTPGTSFGSQKPPWGQLLIAGLGLASVQSEVKH